jgi:hypothetical protein
LIDLSAEQKQMLIDTNLQNPDQFSKKKADPQQIRLLSFYIGHATPTYSSSSTTLLLSSFE